LLTLALVATGGGVLAQQEGIPGSEFAVKKARIATQLDDNTYELAARYQKQPPAPKVRPDVEIEMLLRAAREQEQAGHLDQALALTARMETALQDWRTTLQTGPARTTVEAPHDYIKRLVDLPDDGTRKNATPEQKPGRQNDPPDGNKQANNNRQGSASKQDPRGEGFRDFYMLHQPYALQDKAKPGQKDATSWALGVTIPTPVYDRTNPANRQILNLTEAERLALQFPGTKTIEQPAANKLGPANQERRWARMPPRPTRAEIVALLDRKASLHLAKPTPLAEAVKLIQSAAGPEGAVPIYFDLNGMRKANANLTQSVALDVEDAPLGVALKTLLDHVGLTYQVEDGRVVIGAAGTNPAAPAKP
jgi:hypothetical protein